MLCVARVVVASRQGRGAAKRRRTDEDEPAAAEAESEEEQAAAEAEQLLVEESEQSVLETTLKEAQLTIEQLQNEKVLMQNEFDEWQKQHSLELDCLAAWSSKREAAKAATTDCVGDDVMTVVDHDDNSDAETIVSVGSGAVEWRELECTFYGENDRSTVLLTPNEHMFLSRAASDPERRSSSSADMTAAVKVVPCVPDAEAVSLAMNSLNQRGAVLNMMHFAAAVAPKMVSDFLYNPESASYWAWSAHQKRWNNDKKSTLKTLERSLKEYLSEMFGKAEYAGRITPNSVVNSVMGYLVDLIPHLKRRSSATLVHFQCGASLWLSEALGLQLKEGSREEYNYSSTGRPYVRPVTADDVERLCSMFLGKVDGFVKEFRLSASPLVSFLRTSTDKNLDAVMWLMTQITFAMMCNGGRFVIIHFDVKESEAAIAFFMMLFVESFGLTELPSSFATAEDIERIPRGRGYVASLSSESWAASCLKGAKMALVTAGYGNVRNDATLKVLLDGGLPIFLLTGRLPTNMDQRLLRQAAVFRVGAFSVPESSTDVMVQEMIHFVRCLSVTTSSSTPASVERDTVAMIKAMPSKTRATVINVVDIWVAAGCFPPVKDWKDIASPKEIHDALREAGDTDPVHHMKGETGEKFKQKTVHRRVAGKEESKKGYHNGTSFIGFCAPKVQKALSSSDPLSM